MCEGIQNRGSDGRLFEGMGMATLGQGLKERLGGV